MKTTPPESFQDLGLKEPLLLSIAEAGYEAPTPIQSVAIPPLLAGRDLGPDVLGLPDERFRSTASHVLRGRAGTRRH